MLTSASEGSYCRGSGSGRRAEGDEVAVVTRREFLKLGAVRVGVAGTSSLGFDLARAYSVKQRLRIEGATQSVSVCPYCAVGCSLIAYTRKNADGSTQLLQIEGNPDSPVNEGRLCPKGATSLQLAVSNRRVDRVLFRPARATQWREISWNEALDRLACHVKTSRDRTFVAQDGDGNVVNRTEGIAFAGGAAFSSEEG